MNNSSMVWVPNDLPRPLAVALSIEDPGEKIIERWLYLHLVTAKLDAMIRADPRAARHGLQMSVEHAPGLWSIAQQWPESQWASAVMQSDQTTSLLAPLKTEVIGQLVEAESPSLLEILELLA